VREKFTPDIAGHAEKKGIQSALINAFNDARSSDPFSSAAKAGNLADLRGAEAPLFHGTAKHS
jgi:hypothetical protein